MNKVTDKRLNESYYKTVLPNGLSVYVYPMAQKNGIHAMLSAEIGSVTRDFTLGERHVSAPAGVAHFLEHKLFENEEGDAFSLFAKTGATANAYTSFDRTCYLFSATINIEESLRTLIRFVSNPYFTRQTIEKEQGIIAQEIKMYDDNADWVMSRMMLENLYVKHPLREDIAGTVESISQINVQTLYDCYNAFYRPDNMVLAIAGNIDPELAVRICAEETADVAAPAEAASPVYADEPEEIAGSYSAREMDVFEQQFCFGYKEKPFAPGEETRGSVVLRLMLELLAGETSALYRRLYDEGLINGMFGAGGQTGTDYLVVSFSGESSQPERVVEEIKKEIARQRREGIDGELFEECKRAMIGNEWCSFDSVEGVATNMTIGHFKQTGVFEVMDMIESVTAADVQNMLADMLRDEYSTVAVIKPMHGKGE